MSNTRYIKNLDTEIEKRRNAIKEEERWISYLEEEKAKALKGLEKYNNKAFIISEEKDYTKYAYVKYTNSIEFCENENFSYFNADVLYISKFADGTYLISSDINDAVYLYTYDVYNKIKEISKEEFEEIVNDAINYVKSFYD